MTDTTHTDQHPQGMGYSNAPIARLNALVDEAQGLMDQLAEISSGQNDAIESGDIEQIVEIVTRREPVVRGLVCVGEEIAAFINDEMMISSVDDADRCKALARIATIEHAMKKLRERDARDQKRMESTREGLAKQLATMGTGKSALRAYSTRSDSPSPILQDRQG